ncbi:hypothetical protein DPMN_052365 [Dreissena polymorpha]|uniref:Uncharacterized protein n=1 Tax=Dreissena polymorpha TaxID=45954 RepID=A0A9D4CJJ9_DREPO|nr:hypothetical protein DPMN_052365 [Dreissena polymorpha]
MVMESLLHYLLKEKVEQDGRLLPLPVQYFSTESRGTSSGHQWASVRDVCSPRSCSNFSLRC